jgi:hypothetical protein
LTEAELRGLEELPHPLEMKVPDIDMQQLLALSQPAIPQPPQPQFQPPLERGFEHPGGYQQVEIRTSQGSQNSKKTKSKPVPTIESPPAQLLPEFSQGSNLESFNNYMMLPFLSPLAGGNMQGRSAQKSDLRATLADSAAELVPPISYHPASSQQACMPGNGMENFPHMVYQPLQPSRFHQPDDEICSSNLHPDVSRNKKTSPQMVPTSKEALYMPATFMADSGMDSLPQALPRALHRNQKDRHIDAALGLLHSVPSMLDQLQSAPSHEEELRRTQDIKIAIIGAITILQGVKVEPSKGLPVISDDSQVNMEQINSQNDEMEHLDTDSSNGNGPFSRQTSAFESVPAFSRQASAWGYNPAVGPITDTSESGGSKRSVNDACPEEPSSDDTEAGQEKNRKTKPIAENAAEEDDAELPDIPFKPQKSIDSVSSIFELAEEVGIKCMVKNSFLDLSRLGKAKQPHRRTRSVTPPPRKMCEQIPEFDLPSSSFVRTTTQ